MAWPERLDSIGAIATSCDEKWLASGVRVIEPTQPRTSSLGGGSPSCQDCDATSVEPRANPWTACVPVKDRRPHTRRVTKRCVSSNPATDSRKFEHPLDVRLLVDRTLGLPQPSPPAQHPRNKSVRSPAKCSSRTHSQAFAQERVRERTRHASSRARATPTVPRRTCPELALVAHAWRPDLPPSRDPPKRAGLLPGGSRLTPRFQLWSPEHAPLRAERPLRRIKHGVVDRDVIHPRNL